MQQNIEALLGLRIIVSQHYACPPGEAACTINLAYCNQILGDSPGHIGRW